MEQDESPVQAKPRDFEPESATQPDPNDPPATATPPPHSYDGDDLLQQVVPPGTEEAQD